MEIERKFLVDNLPKGYENNPCKEITQYYISFRPEIRFRNKGDKYFLTIKSEAGKLERDELELPISKDQFESMKKMSQGYLIEKTRYDIPIKDGLICELDIFKVDHLGLILAEVEFPDKESADNYIPEEWFGSEVTYDNKYSNSMLARYF